MSEKNKQIDRLEKKVEKLKVSPKGRRKSRKSSVADSGFFDVTPLTPPLDSQDISTLAKDLTEVMTDSVDDQTTSEFEDKPVVDDEELPITMDTPPSMPPYDCGDVDDIANDTSSVQLLSMPALLCTSSHTNTHISSRPSGTAPRTHGPPQSLDLSSTKVHVNKKQPRETSCTSVPAQASGLEAICSGSRNNSKDRHIDICAMQGNTGQESQSEGIILRNTEHTKSRCSVTKESSRELEDVVCSETNKSLCLSPQQQFEDTRQAERCELQIPGFADFELLSDTSDSDGENTTDEESVLTSSGTIASTNTVAPTPTSFQPIMEVDLGFSSGKPIDSTTGAKNLVDLEMSPEKPFLFESSGVSESSTTSEEWSSFGPNEGESNTVLSRKGNLETNADKTVNICRDSSQSVSHSSNLLEDSIMAEVAAIISHPILGLSTPLGPLPPSPVHMSHSLHRVPTKGTTSQDLDDCRPTENTPSKPKSEKGERRSRKVRQKQSKTPPSEVCSSISIPVRPRKCRGVVIPSSPLVRTTAFKGDKFPHIAPVKSEPLCESTSSSLRTHLHSREDCQDNRDHIASPMPVSTSTTGVPTSVPTARESTTSVPTTDVLAPVSPGDSFLLQEVLNTSEKTDLAQCCPIGTSQLKDTRMEEGRALHHTKLGQTLKPDTTHIPNQTSKPNRPGNTQTSKSDDTQTSKPDDTQTSKPDDTQTSKLDDTQTSKLDDTQTSKPDDTQIPDQANLHMSEQCTMGNNRLAPQWSESCTSSREPLEEGVTIASDLEDGEIDDNISTLDLSPAANHCPDVLASRPGDKRSQLPAGGPSCQLPPKKQPKMPSPQTQGVCVVHTYVCTSIHMYIRMYVLTDQIACFCTFSTSCVYGKAFPHIIIIVLFIVCMVQSCFVSHSQICSWSLFHGWIH